MFMLHQPYVEEEKEEEKCHTSTLVCHTIPCVLSTRKHRFRFIAAVIFFITKNKTKQKKNDFQKKIVGRFECRLIR